MICGQTRYPCITQASGQDTLTSTSAVPSAGSGRVRAARHEYTTATSSAIPIAVISVRDSVSHGMG